LLIGGLELAERFANEGLLSGEDHRLEGGRFQQPGALPILYERFAEAERGQDLAGDGDQDHVGALALIGGAADDGRRPLACPIQDRAISTRYRPTDLQALLSDGSPLCRGT